VCGVRWKKNHGIIKKESEKEGLRHARKDLRPIKATSSAIHKKKEEDK
jgi:hypothetical protein